MAALKTDICKSLGNSVLVLTSLRSLTVMRSITMGPIMRYWAVRPPSMTKMEPVINSESSEAM